ncbi:hypothetical protein AN1V17_10890 [Vallitalea sediminicola]
MQRYRKLIGVGCLVLIIISLICNIFYYKAQQLEEPIILEHYIEDKLNENQDVDLNFYFITNLNDKSKILNVYFPKQDLLFYVDYRQEYETRYYRVNIVNLYLAYDDLNFNENDVVVLEDAVITYNNGLTQNVDIGKIILSNDRERGLESTMSGSSSSGQSSVCFKLNNSFIVNKITSRLYDETNDFVYMNFVDRTISNMGFPTKNVNVHDEKEDRVFIPMDQLPLPHEAINYMEVWSYVKPEDERRFNIYELCYTLEYTYKNGTVGKEDLLNIRYNPCFTAKLISELVKMKRK